MEVNEHFLRQMRAATQLLKESGPAAATAAIQRALQGNSAASDAGTTRAATTPAQQRNVAAAEAAADIVARFRRPSYGEWQGLRARHPPVEAEWDADVAPGSESDLEARGRFFAASARNHAGTRAYKLYVPSCYEGQSLPLVVMLHGCKQNPDDFAAGTGMNALAEKNNCFVVYPAQAIAANGSNCWNWFKAEDQQRDRGEPSIIVQITRNVIEKYHVDPSRVYVAGLSAGGAMAAILGARYPDLYAAIGIHSGLPVGVAHDLPSAFQAMKSGMTSPGHQDIPRRPIPVIVFHGDRDQTVHPCNGDQALAQCLQEREAQVTVKKGRVPHGRAYTQLTRHDRNGKVVAEQWIVHGAGHAWSGGSPEGSYTDPKGPNAAKEMLRFFRTHVRSTS